MKRKIHCPSCQKEVSRDNPYLPFCSDRCRLLDLGRWLNNEYQIAGEKVEKERGATVEQEPDGDEDSQE
ncbi:MAG TPA: DNA gyrase inhibitor YacG [Acidobacteriota bacterium]|nr:DNA gyrase inhibitor YacG [Acidobacteriota bacterium]